MAKLMDSNKKNNQELKTKLDSVIEKSNAQKKMLKKILTQLSKQNKNIDDTTEKESK